MALGAAATGARAATGSTGQGIALMQETIAEAALNELPLVVFNMARGQQDYFQATRGGGWGDYRTITLAPASVVEAAELTRLAFELADQWLTPVIVYGDHLIGFTQMTVEQRPSRRDRSRRPRSRGRSTAAAAAPAGRRSIWTWRQGKHNTPGPGPNRHWQNVAEKYDELARSRRATSRATSTTPRIVVVSFGTTGAFVDYVVDELRADGHRDRHVPPGHALAVPERRARRRRRGDACKQVLVHELNAGPDDRRRAPRGRRRAYRCARSAA